MDLFTVRTLFDRVLEEFPNSALDHYLGTDKDSLTHYPEFEVALVKNISRAPLSKTQKEASKGLLDLQKDTEETSVDYAESILNAKKRNDSRTVDGVPRTNKVERLLSEAGYILTYQRKKKLTKNFEGQIFLNAKKKHFGVWQLNETRQ